MLFLTVKSTKSEHGKLLSKFLKYDDLSAPSIEAFNLWLRRILPLQIANRHIRVKYADAQGAIHEGSLVFTKVDYTQPKYKPLEAVNRGLSYDTDIYADIGFLPEKGKQADIKPLGSRHIATIPVMLGSYLCHTAGKDDTQILQMGLCPADREGHFIVKGGLEKVTQGQEKLRMNRVFIWRTDKKKTETLGGPQKLISQGHYAARMTCQTTTGSIVVVLREGKIRNLRLSLPFLGKDDKGNNRSIGVVQAFRVLGGLLDQAEITRGSPVTPETSYMSMSNIRNIILRFCDQKPLSQRQISIEFEASALRGDQKAPVDVRRHAGESDLAYVKRVQDAAIAYVAKKMRLRGPDQGLPLDLQAREILTGLTTELFPQIHPYDIRRKYLQLALMASQLFEVMIDVRAPDNRDGYDNKRWVLGAEMMRQLFARSFQIFTTKIEDLIAKNNYTPANALTAFSNSNHQNIITDCFISSFVTANWGCKGSTQKETVTDLLKRDNITAVLSQERRGNTPTSRKAKQTSIREIQITQLHIICPAETPEGEALGLVKNPAITEYTSVEREELPLRQSMGNRIRPDSDLVNGFDTKCLINGILEGWCQGNELRAYLVDKRRRGELSRDICIALTHDHILHIHTDTSRVLAPYLIVESGELVIAKKDLWNADMLTLLNTGCVEYLDVFEAESMKMKLARSLWDIETLNRRIREAEENLRNVETQLVEVQHGHTILTPIRKLDPTTNTEAIVNVPLTEDQAKEFVKQAGDILVNLNKEKNWTHCELDPTAIFGIAANIIPLANHDPSARITYQAGMAKQALGIPNANYPLRFDTTMKILCFPTRPIAEPELNSFSHLNEMPTGENVVVAIMMIEGYNQEDGIAISEGYLQRGGMRMMKTSTKKAMLRSTDGFIEDFGRPPLREGEPAGRYLNIRSDVTDPYKGLPQIGSRLKTGDCVIGKITYNKKEGTKQNTSTFVGLSEEGGIVERVLRTEIETGKTRSLSAKVKIREVRTPIEGDKFASRHSQKGVCGLVIANDELPFVATGPSAGITPDFIINPHCITGDTMITFANGLALPISAMTQAGYTVFGWDQNRKGLIPSQQYAFEPKGEREIVKLTFEDGRTIKCTPEHKFLTKRGDEYEWIEARSLQPLGNWDGQQWRQLDKDNRHLATSVVMGLQGVPDIISLQDIRLEQEWSNWANFTCELR